ncbi:hypothetical protein PBI_SCTP2_479 [Salicola phage SCTP-2]|nr:hypothetical protein PBI_SCTP2_479 [Salicola phage SCTP-2]
MYKSIASIQFPEYRGGININMMPIVFGYPETYPETIKGYIPLINQCNFNIGEICYITISESFVPKDQSQRRGGIHVEAPYLKSWGGGTWGGMTRDKGIYMASTDGNTNVWDEIVGDRDEHGACVPYGNPEKMTPNILYWMTDKTPHQALPSDRDCYRQFFRLVSSEISMWLSKHNTKNPYGVKPTCPVVDIDKFEKV